MTGTGLLLDTSVFIARESGRPIDALPDGMDVGISVVTLAELKAGVLAASTTDARMRRMASVELAGAVPCFPIDDVVADAWALLRATVAESGRRAQVNDLWIAATAIRHGLPLVTQDADFDAIAGVRGLRIIRV